MLTGDVFLVDIKVKPTNNIKIYLDSDTGMGIEKCIKINRRLYKVMEDTEVYPDGNFSLEVSSPGLDAPLRMHRQYLKNIGREISIQKADDVIVEGTLTEVTEDHVTLHFIEGKGKKAVEHTVQISFDDIMKAQILIKF